jgi:O-glycosyl hydrolase
MQHVLSHISARFVQRITIGLIMSGLLATATFGVFNQTAQAHSSATVTVNEAIRYQVIDGFGGSDAFRVGSLIRGASGSTLTSAQTKQIMDDLFSPTTGAGFTIVRNEIGALTTGSTGDNQPSIEPNAPSGPNATPTYVFNAKDPNADGDQLWFSQTAQRYGVRQFYADAWSAPQFMKTNGQLPDGGFLCGETGSGAPVCASGDWRQAYANYLTQYARFYHQAGVNLNYIGYINEPDFTPSYVGMNFDAMTGPVGGRGALDPAMPQDIDFIKNYLGPTLRASGLRTKVACCDATSWDQTATYMKGILADPKASANLGLVTGHAYFTAPNGVITTPIVTKGQHVWETETSTFDKFTAAWDDGSDASGFQWAQNLWNALTNANANAFLYWWFAENNSTNPDNEGLININGSTFTVAKRLWAFANYSRFIHPEAQRVNITSLNSNLETSAFRNRDGSMAIVVLNTGTSDASTSFALGHDEKGLAFPYLTNGSNDTARQAPLRIHDGNFTATIPARSLVTYQISR